MAKKTAVKKYSGVYFSESKIKKHLGKPDRCYWIFLIASKKPVKVRWVRCGWASEGWTAQQAHLRRLELNKDAQAKPHAEQPELTFSQLMSDYYLPWTLENHKDSRKDSQRYECYLAPRFGNNNLSEITPLHLEKLKSEMKETLSDATVRHALCVVRQAYNKAVRWGIWSGKNPCSSVKFPVPNNGRLRFLSREEAARLLEALWKRHPMTAIQATLSVYGSLRLSEVFGLSWSHIDSENHIGYVVESKSGIGRQIFLTSPILKALARIPRGKPSEAVFKKLDGTRQKELSGVFKSVVDSLGFNDGVTDRRERVTFHTLRHTFASWAVQAGVPLYTVSKAMGHKTTIMAQRYSHLASDDIRAAFEILV